MEIRINEGDEIEIKIIDANEVKEGYFIIDFEIKQKEDFKLSAVFKGKELYKFSLKNSNASQWLIEEHKDKKIFQEAIAEHVKKKWREVQFRAFLK